ncbi:E3 ubiquitin-protein ligase [Senna tora]|uniref:E3 ubiquitin-protein ligase n=1 Tax=Senna tora TaxID=362788 RepID=A0A834T8H7_9FABA|nr:E3 ubiquitin-protein ligase [Senna tora]
MNSSQQEDQTRSPPRSPRASLLIGMAMRMSRARWFVFLRRVFQYQNGSRSDLGSNPFNTKKWMMMELVGLMVQITVSSVTLATSQRERPVWPMRVWVGGYEVGCVMSLMLLYGRYRQLYMTQPQGDAHAHGVSDVEQQRGSEDARYIFLMSKCQSTLELLLAIWFVMGNVWVFDSRLGSYQKAPKLHILCFSLLAWNALSYSFPFLLFLLLCCFLPLLSTLFGLNFTMSPSHRAASHHQISLLPSWRYKHLTSNNASHQCCICLAKYKEKEEVRQLPCSHMFHQRCVDQWLRIISCCPLCKQGLDS